MKTEKLLVEVPLAYRVGRDEPERGIFRNSAVLPDFADELTVNVTRIPDHLTTDPDLDATPQVHLTGSPRALEALGLYLLALARLETADPEPYGMIEGVTDGEGSAIRLIPRRRAAKDG